MPITNSWADESKTILINDFPQGWTWDEFVKGVFSGYELINKQRLGKLSPRLAEELSLMVRRAMLPVMAVSLDHAVAAAALPGPHRDPWDRLLMAQAQSAKLTLVSVDSIFREYGVPTLW